VEVDGSALLLFFLKSGFNASALLTIGLALHTGLGVVESGGRGRSLRTAAIAAGILLVLTLVRFGGVNAQLGGSLAAAFDASTFSWTWTALGPSSLAIAVGCAGVFFSTMMRIGWVAAVAALLISAGFGLTGHAAALENAGLAPIAAALHVLIAGFWVAAPLSLFPHSALARETLFARLNRFSSYAVFAVPLMFGLGLWLAWSLTGGPQGLIGSIYGRLLLAKFAVASLALTLGAINQRAITRMVSADPARGQRWLARTLGADAVLFALSILVISAATTFTGPPSPS
jgi:copper resistance protein D